MQSAMRFLLLILALGLSFPAVGCAAPPPPNLVVFLVDDMGVMDTSVPFLTDEAGNPQRYPLNDFYRTPNMEKLAARGIRFNQFCAMSVCSPSRASLLTGWNAARHQITNWINPATNNAGPQGPPDWKWTGLKPDDVTLPGLLRKAGYRTIHVGKGHFGPRGSDGENPLRIGFDINVGGSSIGQPGSYYGKDHYGAKGGQASHAVPGLEKYHGTETFLTDALTLEGKAHISDAVKAGKPFFLHLAHYAGHAPFQPDPRFLGHYRNSGKPPQAQAYASLIEGMDQSLGDLMDHLQSLGVAGNTLLIFLGDNGSDAPLGGPHEVACAAPLRGKKGSHYEGGMRVPFIAAWAAADPSNPAQMRLPIKSGGIQTQPAAIYDLFPTLLRAAGTAVPSGYPMDGAPLDPLLSGKPDPARSTVFLMHYPHAPHRSDYFTSCRDDGWKVIYHYFRGKTSNGARYQLFNLAVDPFEQTDLADRDPANLHRMMQLLAGRLEAQGAQYPVDPATRLPLKPLVP